MRYLGIDYGSRRIGIALSDEAGDFAYPYSVVPAGSRAIKEIQSICVQMGVGAIVIGESRNFKGEENPIMEDIRRCKAEIESLTGLPVYFEPEFFTSAAAERLQGAGDMLDASAAALILEGFLARDRKKK